MIKRAVKADFAISARVVGTRICVIASIPFSWSCRDSDHDSKTAERTSIQANDRSPRNRDGLGSINGYRATLNSLDDHSKRVEFCDKNIDSVLGRLSSKELEQLIGSLDYDNSDGDNLILCKAFRELAAKDPKMSLDMAAQMSPNRCEQMGLNIYSVIVKEKPKELSSWIKANDWTDRNSRLLCVFSVAELAKFQPGEATDLLANCDPKKKQRLAYPVLMEIAKTNADEAVQVLHTLSLGGEEKDVMAAIFISYGQIDPAKAIADVSKLDQDYVKSKTIPPLFKDWLDKDAQSAGKSLSMLPSAMVQEILGNKDNLQKLIDADPNLAINALQQMVFTEANSNTFMQAANLLATKDPGAVAAWIAEFPDGPKKGDLVKEVAIARASQDPESSVPIILAEQSLYRNSNIEGAGKAWGKTDPAKALDYLSNLAPSEQSIYVSAVMKASLGENPSATANIISSSALPAAVVISEDYQGIVRSTGALLGSQDIDEAIKWASSLPASEGAAGFAGVASRYAEKDVVAAAEWVKQLPGGDNRNAAIQALVNQIEKTDPKAASQWKSQIK